MWFESVLREKSHIRFSLLENKECGRASVYRKYTKETKDREHKLYSYFIKYKYMFPCTSVRSLACRWVNPTWAMWSTGSRGLEKLLVNYLSKSSLPEYSVSRGLP